MSVLRTKIYDFKLVYFFWDTRYLKVSCEYELHILPNTEVSTAKEHGENYIKDCL